jgi:hypothetical protein
MLGAEADGLGFDMGGEKGERVDQKTKGDFSPRPREGPEQACAEADGQGIFARTFSVFNGGKPARKTSIHLLKKISFSRDQFACRACAR